MYSAEWSQVVKNYEAYKESLSVFRKYISKTKDLSKALHSSNINCYYALEFLMLEYLYLLSCSDFVEIYCRKENQEQLQWTSKELCNKLGSSVYQLPTSSFSFVLALRNCLRRALSNSQSSFPFVSRF